MSTISVGSGESVQAAIDSASNGDRIEIAAGSFQEGIDLGGKSLTLVGAGAASTTIGGTSVAVCLTAAGGDLIVESLSFAGCDTLVAAAGGSFTFTDVELWGSDDPGTADGVDWTWIAGALSLVNGPLTVWNATVDWEGIAISDNTSVSTIVVFNDCVTELLGVEITANTLTYWPSAVLDVSGGALVVDTMDAHDNVFSNCGPIAELNLALGASMPPGCASNLSFGSRRHREGTAGRATAFSTHGGESENPPQKARQTTRNRPPRAELDSPGSKQVHRVGKPYAASVTVLVGLNGYPNSVTSSFGTHCTADTLRGLCVRAPSQASAARTPKRARFTGAGSARSSAEGTAVLAPPGAKREADHADAARRGSWRSSRPDPRPVRRCSLRREAGFYRAPRRSGPGPMTP